MQDSIKVFIMKIMKKIIIIIFIMFISCCQGFAFSLSASRYDPLNPSEKLNYVNIDFFSRFDDDYLVCYICQAVKNNNDARKASWKVEEFRQNVKYSFGKELPSISVAPGYAGLHIPKLDNFTLKQNSFVLPFIASYEPDLLLKNRDKTKSEKKNYEAEKFEEKAAYISLVSDVAAVYVNILQYDRLIELQNEILQIKEKQVLREKLKYREGITSLNEYHLAEKGLLESKNNIEQLLMQRLTLLTQLALLTGTSPECAHDLNRGKIDEFEYNKKIPSEIATDIICSRPDILKSEARLQKAKIDVRVARKEFLPRFYIMGFYIFNTIAPGNFFSWQATLAAILAGATQDIFMGGRKVANLKKQKAYYEEIFEEYQKTNLNAIKEINDTLFMIKSDTNVDKNISKYLDLEKKDYLNKKREYSEGTASYLDLLNEEEKLLNIQQNQIKSKTARIVNYFTLYKAAGANL